MARRSKKAGQLLCGALAAVTLLSVTALAVLRSHQVQRERALIARLRDLTAGVPTEFVRPVAFGEPIEVDPFELYLAAAERARRDGAVEGWAEGLRIAREQPASLGAWRRAVTREHAEALTLLLRGARGRRLALHRHPWPDRPRLSYVLWSLGRIGTVWARLELEAGREREAVRLLLALMQAGVDLRLGACCPFEAEMGGCVIGTAVTALRGSGAGLQDRALLEELSPESLALLAEGVGRVLEALPDAVHAARVELVFWRWFWTHPGRAEWLSVEPFDLSPRDWRHGCSSWLANLSRCEADVDELEHVVRTEGRGNEGARSVRRRLLALQTAIDARLTR